MRTHEEGFDLDVEYCIDDDITMHVAYAQKIIPFLRDMNYWFGSVRSPTDNDQSIQHVLVFYSTFYSESKSGGISLLLGHGMLCCAVVDGDDYRWMDHPSRVNGSKVAAIRWKCCHNRSLRSIDLYLPSRDQHRQMIIIRQASSSCTSTACWGWLGDPIGGFSHSHPLHLFRHTQPVNLLLIDLHYCHIPV